MYDILFYVNNNTRLVQNQRKKENDINVYTAISQNKSVIRTNWSYDPSSGGRVYHRALDIACLKLQNIETLCSDVIGVSSTTV